jgi:pentapeptide MXKDX repeat protein
MKKAILVATCVAALSAFTTLSASAQTTGPASQDTMKKNDSMSGGAMKKGTTGMSSDSMSKGTMTKDGMSKDKSKNGGQGVDSMKK